MIDEKCPEVSEHFCLFHKHMLAPVLDLHSGEIFAVSEVGQGSNHFWIPQNANTDMAAKSNPPLNVTLSK